MHGASQTQATSKFALEALEPRVLLSGDTPFAEVYRALMNDDKDGQGAESDVYVQQLDAETSAEMAAATGSDFGSTSTQAGVTVDWSAGWQEAVSDDPPTTQDTSGSDELAAPPASADTENAAQAAVLERLAPSTADAQASQAEDDSLAVDTSDQDALLSDVPSAELPRGPPAEGQPSAVLTAAASIQINGLGLSSASDTDEGEAFGVQLLIISEVSEDGLPRGPPVADALNDQALAPVLQEAIRLWTAAGLTAELAGRLAGIQVQIADLPDGELGAANQDFITLDTTAAGRGWFVDQTPSDNAEFALTVSDIQVAAMAGSPAFGSIDLLTVLVHEIGHVLGLDHDSGLPVMEESLNPGQRVLVDGNAVGVIAGLGETVSGASHTAPDLVLSAASNDGATINIQVNADGSLTISGTATGDNLSNLAGITNIVGNASAAITLLGPDTDVVWTLNSGSSGSLTIAGGATISFSFVQDIIGGGGDDRLVLVDGTTSLIHFDGQAGFDAVVNQADAVLGSTFEDVDNFIDRPLLFIPGFGGAFVDTTLPDDLNGRDALTQWYLTRGIDPTKLVLEPLANSYSDIVQTLVNTGYTNGTNQAGMDGTLYVSLWDWRVPVAVSSDGSANGVLTDVTAASIVDWAEDSFDSALDYFAYWMDQAAQAWEDLTGAAATEVDLITHSTGGLVARSYLQSHAYTNDVVGDNLLLVNSLIQTGVPNQGAGSIYGMLSNEFGLKSASRGLGATLNTAYELMKGGASISNPDGTSITYNAATTTEVGFVDQYVATLEHLLAVYPFLDATEDNTANYTAISAASGGNGLLIDLNGAGPTSFVNPALRTTYVVYSAAVDTPDLAIQHTGVVPSLGAQNEVLPFPNVIGHLPGTSEVWYEFKKNVTTGDGTVSAFSASNGFGSLDNSDGSDVLFEITQAAAGAAVSHTGITHNTYSQGQILRLLGVDGYATAEISTDLLLNAKESALNLIALGVIDPIDLAQQAFSDTKDLLADIESRFATALNQSLPLIGKSLNQLLLDSGFDLFNKFEAVGAVLSGAVSDAGTLTERLAQLEELLEDAFLFVDVGGANYDNSEIELVYNANDVTLDIVFDFNLADSSQFVLADFDLTLNLGLAFTVSIDFAALIADAAGGAGDSGLELSLALTGAVVIDTADFDVSGVGSVAIDLLEMLGGVPSMSFSVDGVLDLGEAVHLEGEFGFERRTGQSLMLAEGGTGTALSNVAYTLISGEGVAGFFGNGPYTSAETTPNAIGLAISGVDFSLLRLTNGGFNYTAFTTSGGAASLVGVPDLALGASDLSVVFNSSTDAAHPNKVLDFNNGASDSVAGIAVVPLVGPALDIEGEDGAVLEVSGDFALDAFGFVVLAGTFNMVKQTGVSIDDGLGAVATFTADMLRLTLTGSGFVGTGAGLSQDPLTDPSTATVVTTRAVGFNVPAVTLDLVILRDTGTPANKYTALQLAVTNAGLIGIDQLGITVSGTVQVNKGPAAGRLNWSQVSLPGVALTMNQTVELAINGTSIALDAFGFVQLAGTFNLVKQTNVAINDTHLAAFSADVLSLSITASGFAGTGGALSSANNSLATVTVNASTAIGFNVPSGSLNLVLVQDRAVATNKYTGLQVALTNAGLVGIAELGLTVSGKVQVNKGPAAGRLDWTQVTGPTNEISNVTLAMDQTVELAIRDGSVALDAFGFVQFAGSAFTLVKQTNVAIDDGAAPVAAFKADVLSLSITASVFAGTGGALSAANLSTATVTVGDGALGFSVPSASVSLVLVKDRATPANKYTGLQVDVTNAGLVGITGLDLTVSGQVQLNKGPGGNKLDWTQVTGVGKELPSVTLAMNQTVDLAIRNGSIALDAFGFVQLAGTFNLVKQTGVAIDDGAAPVATFNADVLSLSITASGFAGAGGALSAVNLSTATVTVGAGALGFSLPSASVDLVLIQDRATPANKYTGLQVGIINAALVGITDLGITVSGQVQVNKGPAGGNKLDWTQVTGAGPDKELPTITLAMDQTVDLAIRNGSLAVNAFGFVVLAGTFNMVKQTNVSIDDGSAPVATFNADVLSLSITASGFAGVGGSLSAANNSLATVVVGSDAIGLSVPSGSLQLVLVKDRATPTNKYTGMQVGLTNATLVGMPTGFGLTVSGTVQVNKGPAAGPRLDWTEVTGTGIGKELPNVTLTMNQTQELAASGTLSLDVFGFVQVFGSFALAKYSTTVTLAGQSSDTPVDVMAFGMDHVNVFAGAGPYFNTDGTLHASSGDAVGLLLKDTSLALALFTRTDGTTGKYHAVRAFAQTIDPLGLDLGSSDTFSLTASGYRIEINGGKTGTTNAAINFAAGVGTAHGDFVVQTGPLATQTQTFKYSTKLERVAVENARLTIGDYVYVSGGFAFTRQGSMLVDLSGAGSLTDNVNVLAFGAGNVDIFVGSGPYFQANTEVRNPDAIGLALENVNFGLLLMKSTTTPTNKYTALMATADRVGLVGLDSLTLSAGGVTVEYNSSSRTDKKVIDFSGDGKAYTLDTGNGELVIDYGTAVLRASVEDAQLQIESYVFISGGLAFERGPSRTVTLSGNTPTYATVTSIDIGAQDLTMFFGSEGPYWTDLDGDGAISWTDAAGNTLTQAQANSTDTVVDVGETAELNPDAVGFAITNADLAMTLLKPTTGTNTTKYLGLHATADQIGFVGIEAFQLETSTIVLDLNLALGGGATSTTPVVNFASTYAVDERLALFNLLKGVDNSISAEELTAALNFAHGVTESLTTTQELIDLLNAGGAPPNPLLVSEVAAQLSDAFKLANAAAIAAIDADGDGKVDPIGYEIKTGSGYLYLAADSRQIHASADNVLLNVAEFLNVKGSVALDIGSRETVTIDTGIPASLGVQASSAVELVNNALAALEGGLTTLKTSISGVINSVLASLQTQVNTLLEGVIDNIVDYLKEQLASTVSSLSELTQAQISAATTAVNQLVTTALNSVVSALSVNQLIDNLINPIKTPIINAVPDLLKGPVGGLIDTLLAPIREKVSAQFAGLDEALTGAFSRITGSLTEAVDAAIQAAAATASATIEAARTRIETAIHVVLDPQFVRAGAELNKLLVQATAKLVPLFERLRAVTDIEIGANFSTIKEVEVEVTALGISNASAFVGLPRTGGFDFSQPFAGQLGNAVGLSIDGLNLALGIFKPVLGKELPTFTALKLHADDALFSDGGNDVLELIAKDIDVELNLGGPIVKAAGALFGNATIDFIKSFPKIDLPVANAKPAGYAVQTSTTGAPIYIDFDGGEIIRASVAHAELHISAFVHITGSLAFEKGTIQTVDVTGGLTGPLVNAALVTAGVNLANTPAAGLPWAGGTSAELSFMTIGASNVHAFVGIDGPYWTDIDRSDGVSWAFNTGDDDAASRTLNEGSVTIDVNGTPTVFTAGGNNAVLPKNRVVSLSETDDDIQVGGVHYGNINGDDVVDVNETAELSGNAKGLWIERFDFGMAIMRPTNPLDFVKYFALKATANDISVVGIEGVEIDAEDLLVEVNQSTPSIYGLPLFPVVDFASTYESEQQALFNLLAGQTNPTTISPGELTAALGADHGVTADLTTVDELMALLDIGIAPSPAAPTADGVLTVAELTGRLTTEFKNNVLALDADGDGKFDPAGYEVNTGGTPVYLTMDSSLIRAQGFLQLNLFDTVYLTGSVAFELGPTKEVTLSDSTASVPSKKTVTTMTIGAADVTAFIGTGGPYWTDLDKNHEVTRDPLVAGNGDSRIDANESLELKDNAVGFEITDLDIGILVMASIDPNDLGVYLAAKLNVETFGLVGIAGLTATGSFDVALNVGVGLSGLDFNVAVVDFTVSFSEAAALFNLMDTTPGGGIDANEQNAALESGYVGSAITTAAQLVALLNTSNGPPDDYLTMLEVRGKLKDSFETTHQTAINALDADSNTRLNTGFEVNTGNPAAPVVLDFEDFQISIQLGGEIELDNVFRLYGVFIFEVDSSSLKAFVAAGLEIGPDMGDSSKIFNMNALGALVINSAGVAADLNISVSIGGALSDFLQLNATARLVFNTTGVNQSVTIPAKYVDYLRVGGGSIPSPEAFDSSLVNGLKLTQTQLNSRLTINPNGSATYNISGTAPGTSTAGFYLLATFNADLSILRTFTIHADFRLLLSAERFDLGYTGTLALGGFGTFNLTGGAVIDSRGFAAFGSLTVNINVGGLVTVTGGADLKINTATSGPATTVNGQPIDPNTYKVAVRATVGLFGVVSAVGDVEIGLENGVFEIAVNQLTIDLYVLRLDISGYIRSDGQFNLTGSLSMPAALSSGDFGITGGISLTISNSGFTGYGSVGIKVFGQSFNIASAQLSVTANPYSVFIRAEGPLGVYIEITLDNVGSGIHFSGGLGFLDEIIGAIGEVAEAVGQAIADAAVIVGAAFEDLGEAILDLGAAIGDALKGFVDDVGALINDIAGAIAEFFSSSRTIVRTFTPSPIYSYSWSQTGGALIIDMKGGALTGVESPLSLAVVNGKLVVDGPNKTVNVKVADRQRQTRSWDWGAASWGSWHNSGSPYGEVYADIEYSNMKAFVGVTSIEVRGTEGNDTIVMDAASISIPAHVYGYAGNDNIFTGNGNDYVDGGTGNDLIYTYGGADELHGGDDNDNLAGGTGNDALYGDAGNDLLNENLDRGNNPRAVLAETNLLDGGAGDDNILGSPGIDTIVGGNGDDKVTGLSNDDIYVFNNSYGTDKFADYFGKAYLDFSAVTGNLAVSISDTGLTVNGGDGHLFAVANFISIQKVAKYADFQIVEIKTGTGSDTVAFTALAAYRMDIVDAGGVDLYDFNLDQADVAQSGARVDIVDNGGTAGQIDQIDLDVNSTGFDIYLHLHSDLVAQAVLLNNFELTFNFDEQIEVLNLTDHAADTTVTTKPSSGLKTLLVKDDVTITSATGGSIELTAKDDFLMELGALIQTLGAVVIRGDDEDGDSTGATINLFGTINANTVTIYGNGDNDTVNITNVVAGAETTVHAGAGNDVINVGTTAPAAGGNLDAIGALLTINGEGGLDTLNADDSGDTDANIGALTATTITGLAGTGGSFVYGTIETLNIGLGTAGDVFTIQSTHTGVTNLNTNNGDDVINVQAIAGITNVNGGAGSEAFNVGSNAQGTQGSAALRGNNSGGTVDGIGALLTLNGNDPTSGSDVLIVDDTLDTSADTGTLTSTTITGLDMGGSITYGTIEHLTISLGSGGNTFTIASTHGATTSGFQEDTTVNSGSGADTVNINDVTDLLYVNGQASGDTINVNGTGAGSVVTLNGGTGADTVNVNGVTNLLEVNGQDDADTVNVNGTGTDSAVTVNAGAGADTVNINGVSNLLYVNGQADADTINVNGTGAISVSTLNGDAGTDVINVRAMDGTVNANGGADNDTINVGSDAPTLPGDPTNLLGTIDAINGKLTVNGGGGTGDTLNVDDSDPLVTTKSGALTTNTLSGLALEQNIDYSLLETLNIWLAIGANIFTINSTHAGATTLSTALGDDIVHVNGASGTLTINAEAGSDVVNVRATGEGSQTYINGQGGNDTVNLSDNSPLLPVAYPTIPSPPAADTEGTIDAIDGLVDIDGGADVDVINIDDSRNANNKAGTLAATTLRGLALVAGVDYSSAEQFNLWLGTGTDGLYIDSTHAGTTDIYAGDGITAVNQHDDLIAIRSIGGVTTIHGQGGNDSFYVNVIASAANDPSFWSAAAAAANENHFNSVFTRTDANGLAAVLNLHGDGNSDQYTLNFAGQGAALVNVIDNGAADNGVDTLIVNGSAPLADTFLLRRTFVALLNDATNDGTFDTVERVNYDENINARLIVNGLGGNDKFVADDNSAITTLDGGDGDDTFQIGQVFGTLRDAGAGVAPGDEFNTTPVIIGVITDPQTEEVIFDPTSFDPVTQVLPESTVGAINAAILHQRNLGLALNGVAYVSSGVTHATTIFGGNGQDTFNVYHNKGTLRLEGEADNDIFTVRAFVTVDLSVQGETEVNGGAGTDTVNYAINAPVSIDGGAGFDRVVVLGTPFNDSFVVSSEGIFGAGLNVKFVNIESAELDALEGDDTIYILGTADDLVTTVIGGLGDDTINVMGDVMKPIVSDDLLGRSGVISQGLTSGDADYNLVGVNGVATHVISAGGENAVNISPTGEPLRVTEDGSLASYFISLVAPDALKLASMPVYLTVSAGVASGTDRSIGGAGVLVSVNGGAFTNAVVLTFDGTTADDVFTIDVMAVDDSGAEGPRVALISHSINSVDTGYDDLSLADIFVNVVDNDKAGLDIRHQGDTYGNNSTQVLENGFGDTYSVALTTAPANGEIVTVTLVTDAQITAISSGLGYLTFNESNWNTPQTVVVTAFDDGLDGIEISRITHAVTSTGGVYAGFPTTSSSRLSVTVYDDDTPGAIVQQTGGSTIVAEGAPDSYRVRLTGAPDSNVTLTLRTDMQTLLSGTGVLPLNVSGSLGYFEYGYTFTTDNWDEWADITVSANPSFTGSDDKIKAFATQDQNLDQIRGPLIIEGGVGSGVARAIEEPVMLPSETNNVSASEFGDPNSAGAVESNDIDVLNVFHTDNSDTDTGKLYYRNVDEIGNAIANAGLALTGFEMGNDLRVEQGTIAAPSTVYYGGGITYNAFEIVEVLLGKGNETLTVDDTGDRDEKALPANAVDHAAITAIHGGGGGDTITINNRGEGPLVVYGDTSVDGTRYSNNQPAGSVNGTSFSNPGNDTINASAMLEQGDAFVGVVIYGGDGIDTITGSQDDDHLAGGSGADTLHGQAGHDDIYGDSNFTVNPLLFAQDQVSRFATATQLASISAMFTVVTTGSGGADIINGDSGNDVVFGDHGVLGQVDGTRRIESTGNIVRLETTNLAAGGGDLIHGNDGNDFIFGGMAGDTIYGDLGSELIFGDYGSVVGSAASNVNADRIGLRDGAGVDNANATFIYTSDTSAAADASAGNDTIYGGSLAVLDIDTGKNILMGQQGSDTLYGGGGDDDIYGGHNVANGTDVGDFIDGAAGNDVILGDNGLIERTAAAIDPRFAVLQGQLLYDSNGLVVINAGVAGVNPSAAEARRIQLFDHNDSANNAGNFGNDTIAGGADDDVIFGELGADTIHGDGMWNGTTLAILTASITGSDVGGDDYVEGNGGGDTIYGGLGQDDLVGGSSSLYNLTASNMRPDGADTIFGGNGDMTARNTEGDGSHARDSDMILGDNGDIFRIVGVGGTASGAPTFNYDNYAGIKIVVRAAQLLDYTPGGPDLVLASLTGDRGAGDELHGESGDDFMYGMTGNDVMFGEGQDDDLIGGWGHDWISGGTGQDGVLGDDGRIFTSRNGTAESLYGIVPVAASSITTPGDALVATINVAGQLKKSVDLTPYNVDPAGSELFRPAYANDIIYGGLGSDFLHGGSGDDAISGAEAMESFYAAHANGGNVLAFNLVTGEFAAYNEKDALKQIPNFLLNFNAGEGVAVPGTTVFSDGDDVIFGDLGNDWLVGGTGRDHMYGGWGNDLLNGDDDLSTNGGLNNLPDTQTSYEDIAFGGAGRDRLIANTAGDRMTDWTGEFNSFLVPFKQFGVGTVIRGISPGIPEFLYALSKADGADQTLGGDPTRNSEPFGELGLVKQGDAAWGTQTGGPDDPQPGSGGGKK